MREDHWGEEDQLGGASPDGGAPRAAEILGRWSDAAGRELGWGFGAWFDPAVLPVAASLASGTVDEAAVRSLSAGRYARGYADAELATDLDLAWKAAGNADGAPAAVQALAAQSFRGDLEEPSWFGDARGLVRSLRRLGSDGEGGAIGPYDVHALLVLDIDTRWLGARERGAALALAADRLHREFPFAPLVACLGESRLAVVVRRHPGLAVGAEALRIAVETDALLVGATRVWLVPLPLDAASVGPFVRDLAGTARPLRVRTFEPGAAAGGGPGSELLRTETMPTASRGGHGRQRLAAWLEGAPMVASAIAVLLAAMVVAQAIGPVPGLGTSTTTAPFGPAIAAPPDDLPPAASPGEEVAAPAPLPEPAAVPQTAPPAAPLVRTAAATTIAPTPPPPVPAPAPEPPPPPQPAPAPPPEPPQPPAVEPAPAPVVVTCAGLDGREERACEREQRSAERGKGDDRDDDARAAALDDEDRRERKGDRDRDDD